VVSVAAPPPRPPVVVTLLERAERLRDAIQESKLSAADPWGYAPKARGWGERAQALVDEIARSGPDGSREKAVGALGAEVESDLDYQEARRRA
jgi:hypothetical protein